METVRRRLIVDHDRLRIVNFVHGVVVARDDIQSIWLEGDGHPVRLQQTDGTVHEIGGLWAISRFSRPYTSPQLREVVDHLQPRFARTPRSRG